MNDKYMYVFSCMTSPKDVAGIFGPFFGLFFFQLPNPPEVGAEPVVSASHQKAFASLEAPNGWGKF